MARLLTTDEIAGARCDPRFQPQRRCNPKNLPDTTPGEVFIARTLSELRVTWEYEAVFFPLMIVDSVEFGFCPDFRVICGRRHPEQYLEVSESTRPKNLKAKRVKIMNAWELYGIRLRLIDLQLLRSIRQNPSLLRTLLRTWNESAEPVFNIPGLAA